MFQAIKKVNIKHSFYMIIPFTLTRLLRTFIMGFFLKPFEGGLAGVLRCIVLQHHPSTLNPQIFFSKTLGDLRDIFWEM